jgi:hypothetical protein
MANSGIAIENGAQELHGVSIESYNLEIKKGEDWLGDQASRLAFWKICDDHRKLARAVGFDPFARPTSDLSKKDFDRLLASKDARTVAFAYGVVEAFAQRLVEVIHRFLEVKKWKGTELIVFGGGLMTSRAGLIAIERAALLLAADGTSIALRRTAVDPDVAGLIGTAQLFPAWMLKGYNGMLAVDIGGTNIRAAILEIKNTGKDTHVRVFKNVTWKQDKSSRSREAAVKRMVKALNQLIKFAKSSGLNLAPLLGIGCPGIIERDGSVRRGDQNLPGNWQSDRFNLPESITSNIPKIDDHRLQVVMHNDAVVQGLSEKCALNDIRHWAVLTIGTGLGNAKYSIVPES